MAINPVNSSAAQHLQQTNPGHLDQLLLQARQARQLQQVQQAQKSLDAQKAQQALQALQPQQGQNDHSGKTVGSIIDIHV